MMGDNRPSLVRRYGGTARHALLMALCPISPALGAIDSITGYFDDSHVHFAVVFGGSSPITATHGFQLFVDADGAADTGYGQGYDVLVRGVYPAPPLEHFDQAMPDSESYVYLRVAEAGSGPGGWGPAIASIPVEKIDDWHLAFDVPLGVGPLRSGGFRYSFEVYAGDRLVDATYNEQTEPGGGDPLDTPICVVSTTEWQTTQYDPQGETFAVAFDVIPNDDGMSSYVGLSEDTISTAADIPVLIHLHPRGLIELCTEMEFAADTAVPYQAGTAYHFEIEVNTQWNTYSASVTPESSPPAILATHYAFCASEYPPAVLSGWSLIAPVGSQQVCNVVAGPCAEDSDFDSVLNCYDMCPFDSEKSFPGTCGCGVEDLDVDGDGIIDCRRADANSDGVVDHFDYVILLSCVGGPGDPPNISSTGSTEICERAFDFDSDRDVDMLDHARFTGGGYVSGGGSFVPGDANRDGRLDNLDFVQLVACRSAPGSVPAPAGKSTRKCLGDFDADGDADVDMRDAAEWLDY